MWNSFDLITHSFPCIYWSCTHSVPISLFILVTWTNIWTFILFLFYFIICTFFFELFITFIHKHKLLNLSMMVNKNIIHNSHWLYISILSTKTNLNRPKRIKQISIQRVTKPQPLQSHLISWYSTLLCWLLL
jgi:hypothetical protein